MRVSAIVASVLSLLASGLAFPSPRFEGRRIELEDGMKVVLDGTEGVFQYTRIWLLGDQSKVTKVFFVLHGDKVHDYSDETAQDRAELAASLPPGEGAILAYPISAPGRSWPAFTGGELQLRNGPLLIRMFRQLAASAGNEDASCEQFALSGGGKVNMALMMTILDEYDSNPEVRSFVDDSLRGIHDGAALCYDTGGMVAAYYRVLSDHPAIRATFIHNTKPGEEVDYGYLYHRRVAELLGHGLAEGRFPKGGKLSLEGGRYRFWSSPLHLDTWRTQFARVLAGSGLPE